MTAYWLLARAIIATDGPASLLAQAIGKDHKGIFSVVAYAIAIPLAFAAPWLAEAVYVGVALVWLIPDRRIERVMR